MSLKLNALNSSSDFVIVKVVYMIKGLKISFGLLDDGYS